MDAVYPAIEEAESELHADLERMTQNPKKQTLTVEPLKMDADADRKPRGLEEMVEEAESLRGFFKAEMGANPLD